MAKNKPLNLLTFHFETGQDNDRLRSLESLEKRLTFKGIYV